MNRLQDPQAHDDLLNYRLVRLARIGGASAIRICEGRFGVSRSEWRVVAALAEDGPMSPTTLAQRIGRDPGRASRLLHRLVAKRFVRRSQVDGDLRRAVVAATVEGERLYAALWPELAALNRQLTACLDAEEAAIFDRCLEKLTVRACRIEEAAGGIDPRTDRRLGGSRRFWDRDIE